MRDCSKPAFTGNIVSLLRMEPLGRPANNKLQFDRRRCLSFRSLSGRCEGKPGVNMSSIEWLMSSSSQKMLFFKYIPPRMRSLRPVKGHLETPKRSL